MPSITWCGGVLVLDRGEGGFQGGGPFSVGRPAGVGGVDDVAESAAQDGFGAQRGDLGADVGECGFVGIDCSFDLGEAVGGVLDVA